MAHVLPLIDCDPPELSQLMLPDPALDLAEVVRALADPVRLRLLRFVADSPDTTVCACHLPTALGISQPTLSHHLKKLVAAGLLLREQRGRWAHYRIGADALAPLETYVTGLRSAVTAGDASVGFAPRPSSTQESR